MRGVAITAGLAILASATWAVITDAHLGPPHAALVAAMAIGTAAGAVVMARCSWRVGVLVALAVLCGESYGMLATAERIIRHREAVALADAARNPAVSEGTRARIASETALARHDTEARARVSDKGCGPECRKLLDETRARLVADRDRAALAASAAAGVRSNLLADRLGIQSWVLDLIVAGLLSLGANGMACVLIAYGSHSVPRAVAAPVRADPTDETPAVPTVIIEHDPSILAGAVATRKRASKNDAARFALARLKPVTGADVTMKEMVDAYWAWCDGEILERPDIMTSLVQMQSLLGVAGLRAVKNEERGLVVKGLALAA